MVIDEIKKREKYGSNNNPLIVSTGIQFIAQPDCSFESTAQRYNRGSL